MTYLSFENLIIICSIIRISNKKNEISYFQSINLFFLLLILHVTLKNDVTTFVLNYTNIVVLLSELPI